LATEILQDSQQQRVADPIISIIILYRHYPIGAKKTTDRMNRATLLYPASLFQTSETAIPKPSNASVAEISGDMSVEQAKQHYKAAAENRLKDAASIGCPSVGAIIKL